jgi:hypothetical protein
MARMFKAVCLRDCVQDVPYMYYKAGMKYTIPEDSPVLPHFQPLEELSKKEADKVKAEGPPPPEPHKVKKARASTAHGPGYAEEVVK